MGYVTYSDLIQIGLFVITSLNLIITIYRDKK